MGGALYEIVVKDPALQVVFRELGRRTSFGAVAPGKAGNFDALHLKITFPTANTEFRVTHGLSRVPVGMAQVSDLTPGLAIGVRIEPTKAPTSLFLYLKCAEARTVEVMIW